MEEARMSDWNAKIIEEFRANDGRVASFGSQPLLLLTVAGAKTGTRRTYPLAAFRDGDRYVVVASKGGAPDDPDWYRNLLANPRATIETGTETIEVTASPAEGDERARLWADITSANDAFAGYQAKVSRTIPVVVLTPAP
jgi:deazaflavin-dependent oxidoreductase (nitroreductase family)